MRRTYGICFQGSKSRLAERIVDVLPSADNLYDLFGGGCAISHCALLSGKWKHIHINDITDSVVLFDNVLKGNIPDGSEWISREEFYKRKDSDPYIRLVWSFGNNQRDYLYSQKLEPYKKAVHEMIFGATPNERRLKFKEVCRLMPQVIGVQENGGGTTDRPRNNRTLPEVAHRLQSAEALPPHIPQQVSYLQSNECYQRMCLPMRAFGTLGGYGITDRLQTEERRDKIRTIAPFCGGEYRISVGDYRDVQILPNSVIYCDIPYKGTREYRHDVFDHDAFYEWALKQTEPIFISEYDMPDDFVAIAEWTRNSTFSASNNALKRIEKLFVPRSQLKN